EPRARARAPRPHGRAPPVRARPQLGRRHDRSLDVIAPVKRRVLLGSLALTLVPIGACLAHFGAEIHTTGIASGPLLAATGSAALALALGAAASARIRRAAPAALGFLGARYVRLVFCAVLIAFVIALF